MPWMRGCTPSTTPTWGKRFSWWMTWEGRWLDAFTVSLSNANICTLYGQKYAEVNWNGQLQHTLVPNCLGEQHKPWPHHPTLVTDVFMAEWKEILHHISDINWKASPEESRQLFQQSGDQLCTSCPALWSTMVVLKSALKILIDWTYKCEDIQLAGLWLPS